MNFLCHPMILKQVQKPKSTPNYKIRNLSQCFEIDCLDYSNPYHQSALRFFCQSIKQNNKKLNNFNPQQHEFLRKIVTAINLSIKQKGFDFDGFTFCLEEICFALNLYENQPNDIPIDKDLIRKISRSIEELMEKVEHHKNSKIDQQSKFQYQNVLSSILYLIIILIAKAQRQKGIETKYRNLLQKFLTPTVRGLLVELPEPKDQKTLKFYAVVVGHLGEKFPSDKCNSIVIQKLFSVFEKLNHENTLYYLANFLRQKVKDFKFQKHEINPLSMIKKMQFILKGKVQNYQIASFLQLYVKTLCDNTQYIEAFYDAQILQIISTPSIGINIKFPSNCYKQMFFKSANKLLGFYLRMNVMDNYVKERWIDSKLKEYLGLLMVSNINVQENASFFQLLSTNISQSTLLEMFQQRSMEMLVQLSQHSNGNIQISVINVVNNWRQRINNFYQGLSQGYSETFERIINNLMEINSHYMIVQRAKKIQLPAYRKIQDQLLY